MKPLGSVLAAMRKFVSEHEPVSVDDIHSHFGWSRKDAAARTYSYVRDGHLHKAKRPGERSSYFFLTADAAAKWASDAVSELADRPADGPADCLEDEGRQEALYPKQLRTTAHPGQAPQGAVSSVFALAGSMPEGTLDSTAEDTQPPPAPPPNPLAWKQPLPARIKALMSDRLIRTSAEIAETLQVDRQRVMEALSALKLRHILVSHRTPGHKESHWSLVEPTAAVLQPATRGEQRAPAEANAGSLPDDHEFLCALYSDGVLWFQLSTGQQVNLDPEETSCCATSVRCPRLAL